MLGIDQIWSDKAFQEEMGIENPKIMTEQQIPTSILEQKVKASKTKEVENEAEGSLDMYIKQLQEMNRQADEKQAQIKNHPVSKQIQINPKNSNFEVNKKYSPLTTSVLQQRGVYRANNKSRSALS